MKTIEQNLNEQFGAAIIAILGDLKDLPESELLANVSASDLTAIAKKVAFYLDI